MPLPGFWVPAVSRIKSGAGCAGTAGKNNSVVGIRCRKDFPSSEWTRYVRGNRDRFLPGARNDAMAPELFDQKGSP